MVDLNRVSIGTCSQGPMEDNFGVNVDAMSMSVPMPMSGPGLCPRASPLLSASPGSLVSVCLPCLCVSFHRNRRSRAPVDLLLYGRGPMYRPILRCAARYARRRETRGRTNQQTPPAIISSLDRPKRSSNDDSIRLAVGSQSGCLKIERLETASPSSLDTLRHRPPRNSALSSQQSHSRLAASVSCPGRGCSKLELPQTLPASPIKDPITSSIPPRSPSLSVAFGPCHRCLLGQRPVESCLGTSSAISHQPSAIILAILLCRRLTPEPSASVLGTLHGLPSIWLRATDPILIRLLDPACHRLHRVQITKPPPPMPTRMVPSL